MEMEARMLLLALFLTPPKSLPWLTAAARIKFKMFCPHNPGTKELFTTLLNPLVQDYTPACQQRSLECLACPPLRYRPASNAISS